MLSLKKFCMKTIDQIYTYKSSGQGVQLYINKGKVINYFNPFSLVLE